MKIGSHVKCVLKTGMVVEGFVESWEKQVKLKSIDGKSVLIIPHPDDDIMLIKVLLDVKSKEIKDLEIKFEEVRESNKDVNDDLRNKTLAELKIEMNKQEKEDIAAKLKNHTISTKQQIIYSYPGAKTKHAKE